MNKKLFICNAKVLSTSFCVTFQLVFPSLSIFRFVFFLLCKENALIEAVLDIRRYVHL